MLGLSDFNRELELCIGQKDGIKLRDLLCLSSEHATVAMEQYVIEGGSLPQRLEDPWEKLPEIIDKRFQASAALNANNWVDTFDHLAQMLTMLITGSIHYESAWCVPALIALCVDLRVVGEEADRQLIAAKQKPRKLEEAERVLKKGFTMTNNDRRTLDEGSKKIGTLGIVNQLLKIYFKLNNLRLCGNLTKSVNLRSSQNFDQFPVSHRATYRYYTGRLHLYEDRHDEAVNDLQYSLMHLPKHLHFNKRQILLYLIPSRILTGSLPSQTTLNTFEMLWFKDIVRAIKSGNLGLFNEAVAEHEEFFISKALHLAVEKMRPLVLRSLCKRIESIWVSNKIPLRCISSGLQVCSVEMETDEVECMLANLIFNGYIKGYISHKVGYLVLSKKNPFPRAIDRSRGVGAKRRTGDGIC